jgi:hypothetical protein
LIEEEFFTRYDWKVVGEFFCSCPMRVQHMACWYNPCRARSLPKTAKKKMSGERRTIPSFFQFLDRTDVWRHMHRFPHACEPHISDYQRAMIRTEMLLFALLSSKNPWNHALQSTRLSCTTSGDSTVSLRFHAKNQHALTRISDDKNWRWHPSGSEIRALKSFRFL